MNKRKYKKLNILCIITIIISIILGFFNPYENYMTIIYNFWYPFAMFIYLINVKISKKISGNTVSKGEVSGVKGYVNNYCKLVKSKKTKIFIIGGLCYIKIMFTILQFQLYSSKVPSEISSLQNTFLLNNAFLMLILATLAELVVLITFSIRIWKENGQGDETNLCR
ncbi:hypothetical protein ACWO4B_001130 [Clostridium sporogenes]